MSHHESPQKPTTSAKASRGWRIRVNLASWKPLWNWFHRSYQGRLFLWTPWTRWDVNPICNCSRASQGYNVCVDRKRMASWADDAVQRDWIGDGMKSVWRWTEKKRREEKNYPCSNLIMGGEADEKCGGEGRMRLWERAIFYRRLFILSLLLYICLGRYWWDTKSPDHCTIHSIVPVKMTAFKPRNLLLIGATGTVGRFITQSIVSARSEFDRIAVLTSAPATHSDKEKFLEDLKSKNVEIMIGDINNESDVTNAYKGS